MIGASSNLIPPESAWIKNTWGYGLFFLYTIIPAIVEAAMTNDYSKKVRQSLTIKNALMLLAMPPLHLTWYWGLYFGAERII